MYLKCTQGSVIELFVIFSNSLSHFEIIGNRRKKKLSLCSCSLSIVGCEEGRQFILVVLSVQRKVITDQIVDVSFTTLLSETYFAYMYKTFEIRVIYESQFQLLIYIFFKIFIKQMCRYSHQSLLRRQSLLPVVNCGLFSEVLNLEHLMQINLE